MSTRLVLGIAIASAIAAVTARWQRMDREYYGAGAPGDDLSIGTNPSASQGGSAGTPTEFTAGSGFDGPADGLRH